VQHAAEQTTGNTGGDPATFGVGGRREGRERTGQHRHSGERRNSPFHLSLLKPRLVASAADR
jgi:hypothetical protein